MVVDASGILQSVGILLLLLFVFVLITVVSKPALVLQPWAAVPLFVMYGVYLIYIAAVESY